MSTIEAGVGPITLSPVSAATTKLDGVVSGVVWEEGFSYGAGVDAVTGGLTGSAVAPFQVQETKRKSSTESYRFVQDSSDMSREVSGSLSVKYNVGGTSVNASSEFLTRVTFSEKSVTLIAEYRSDYEDYDEAPAYALTEAARALMADPEAFRSAYGDYFVAGGRRGSYFTALYLCTSGSASSMDTFKATFGGSAPDVFSAEGSAAFTKAASECHVDTTVEIFMGGYEGTPPSGPWTPETINTALEWFKAHDKGVKLEAKLKHYNILEPTYPRTVDVDPDVFVELQLLYVTAEEAELMYGECPAAYQGGLKDAYTALTSGVTAYQAVLATDADRRAKLAADATALRTALMDVFTRQGFYIRVQDALATEPGKGKKRSGSSSLFGFDTTSATDVVAITANSLHYKKGWTAGDASHLEHTMNWGGDAGLLVVGWKVKSEKSNNGSWWMANDDVLLTHKASIKLKSDFDRGVEYTLHVYTVPTADYQFED